MWIATVLLAVPAYFAAEHWFASLRALDPAEAVRQSLTALRAMGVGMGALVAGLGVWALRLGQRVGADERFPPRSVAVIRRTRVLEGAAARRRGRLLVGIGVALVALALLLTGTVFWVAAVLNR